MPHLSGSGQEHSAGPRAGIGTGPLGSLSPFQSDCSPSFLLLSFISSRKTAVCAFEKRPLPNGGLEDKMVPTSRTLYKYSGEFEEYKKCDDYYKGSVFLFHVT